MKLLKNIFITQRTTGDVRLAVAIRQCNHGRCASVNHFGTATNSIPMSDVFQSRYIILKFCFPYFQCNWRLNRCRRHFSTKYFERLIVSVPFRYFKTAETWTTKKVSNYRRKKKNGMNFSMLSFNYKKKPFNSVHTHTHEK